MTSLSLFLSLFGTTRSIPNPILIHLPSPDCSGLSGVIFIRFMNSARVSGEKFHQDIFGLFQLFLA